MKLTAKERAFAAAYVKDPSRNASAAARAAGYSGPRGAGYRALKRPDVRAKIADLETVARKRVKTQMHKAKVAEVIPGPVPTEADMVRTDVGAVASRAECLAIATNAVRGAALVGDKLISDVFDVATTPGGASTLVSNAVKLGALPMSALRDISHDETGDLKLRFADPLPAARLLLDDHARAHGTDDHMAGPRQVVNILMFEGTQKDREAFDELSRRMARLGGGNGDGDGNR